MAIPQNITNESQIGAENTYILERDPAPSVTGVTLNNFGIAGECVKGPANQLVKVTSPGRFDAIFGGRDYGSGGPIVGDVWKFLLNRTFGAFYVYRTVAATGATTAEADFNATATPIINVAASSPGAWGNGLLVAIEDASDGNANHFNIVVTWNSQSQKFENLDTSATGNNNLLAVIGDDTANLVVVTKVADGRPDTAAAAGLADTAGADGTIADSDYTAAGLAIDTLNDSKDVNIATVAGRMNSAVKTSINTKAAAAGPGKLWIVGPDSEVIAQATYETEINGYTATDRMIPTFNHERIQDPSDATKIWQAPEALMCSILSQTPGNVHPGSMRNRRYAAGTIELAHELSEGDFDSLRDNRISAIEKVSGGFVFRSGVTSETGTKGEITARRQKDELILAAANRVEFDVKEPNSAEIREARAGDIGGFLANLAENGQYVDLKDGNPAFEYDTESLNTDVDRANGIQRDRMSVKLIPHGLFLVLVTTIDTANSEFFSEEG
jgi:hypothetical protein